MHVCLSIHDQFCQHSGLISSFLHNVLMKYLSLNVQHYSDVLCTCIIEHVLRISFSGELFLIICTQSLSLCLCQCLCVGGLVYVCGVCACVVCVY